MPTQQQAAAPGNASPHEQAHVDITYYTDPLCCWSWAFETQWRKLLEALGGTIIYRYCMAGLLPAWKNYHDPLHAVSRPVQMGPVWMHARQVSWAPIYDRIWFEDPPASSWPACMAVKCAALQSFRAGEAYLRKAREAVMTQGVNIAKETALLEIAGRLAEEDPLLLDAAVFSDDLKNGKGMELFRKDMQEVQYRGIDRFPTLIIRYGSNPPVIVTGYRPYDVLLEIINGMVKRAAG